MKSKIILALFLINIYFLTHLFLGNNNIQNYVKYKQEIKHLKDLKHNIIQQRFDYIQISDLLSKPSDDNLDLLDELIRNKTNAVLPEEKIVLLSQDNE